MTLSLSKFFKGKNNKSEANSKEDQLIKQAGYEFKKLVERGLDLPVALL